MTVADTIYDTIVDNWGGGGYGGAAPTFASTEAAKSTDVTTTDLIEVRHYSVRESPRPVNDVYTDRFYTIDVLISSKTTAAQLKLLVDEAEYLLRNTAMTDLQFVNVTKDYTSSVWGMAKHAVILKVEVVSLMSSGAITPASTTTGYNWLEANMIGSANAAWVPCVFHGGDNFNRISYGVLGNGTNGTWGYLIPRPKELGTLKLYCTGYRTVIYDADATNYLNQAYIAGMNNDTVASLAATIENANRTARGTYTVSFAAQALTVYEAYVVVIVVTSADANAFDLMTVEVQVYYDT